MAAILNGVRIVSLYGSVCRTMDAHTNFPLLLPDRQRPGRCASRCRAALASTVGRAPGAPLASVVNTSLASGVPIRSSTSRARQMRSRSPEAGHSSRSCLSMSCSRRRRVSRAGFASSAFCIVPTAAAPSFSSSDVAFSRTANWSLSRSAIHCCRRFSPADEKRLQQWIADLDSDQFAVREKATSELEKLGAAAVGTMQKALEAKPALETRRRLEQLIDKQEREEWPASGERLRIWRALEVLERIGTPEAREVLTTLANGAPGARPDRKS